jgi:hypothetical protein
MRTTEVACMQLGRPRRGRRAGVQALTSAMLADFLAGSTKKPASAGSNIQPKAFSASTAPGTCDPRDAHA